MRAKLLSYVHSIKSSYWFVPSCMVLAAIFLALTVRYVALHDSLNWVQTGLWFGSVDTAAARALLTMVAGSVIGVAGVTFSITIVAVSFASANFGPRLIGNFMTDRGSQFTLGTFISTFVFCTLSLPVVQAPEHAAAMTSRDTASTALHVELALLLALLCVGVFIYFINHAAEKINIENIVADIGRQLSKQVQDAFPFHIALPIESINEGTPALPLHGDMSIQSHTGGYVQALAIEQLVERAEQLDVDIRLHYRPGDFVAPGDTLMSIYGATSIEESDQSELRGCLATGNQRTEPQNVLFRFEQLLEVIARSLSPGVNDPYTAITCFNWLKSPLTRALQRSSPGGGLVKVGRIRFVTVDITDILDTVFGSSIDYVADDTLVTLHVLALLAELSVSTGCDEHRKQLLEHLDHVAQSARRHAGGPSAHMVAERYEQARAVMTGVQESAQLRRDANWFGGSA